MAVALNPLLNLYSRALGSIIATMSVIILLCPHRLPAAIGLPDKVPCYHLPSHAKPALLFLGEQVSFPVFLVLVPSLPPPWKARCLSKLHSWPMASPWYTLQQQ